MNSDEVLFFSSLRSHMQVLHQSVNFAQSDEDLIRQHVQLHLGNRCSHYHVPDNEGTLAGQDTNWRRRKPSGHLTGNRAVMRQAKRLR